MLPPTVRNKGIWCFMQAIKIKRHNIPRPASSKWIVKDSTRFLFFPGRKPPESAFGPNECALKRPRHIWPSLAQYHSSRKIYGKPREIIVTRKAASDVKGIGSVRVLSVYRICFGIKIFVQTQRLTGVPRIAVHCPESAYTLMIGSVSKIILPKMGIELFTAIEISCLRGSVGRDQVSVGIESEC